MTPSGLFSQETPPPVINYQGQVGIFLTEAQARQAAEDRIKGFAYFTNWKISEVQLQDKDLRIQNLEISLDQMTLNWEDEKLTTQGGDSLLVTCKGDRDHAVELYLVAQKKAKLLPWIGAAGILVGGYLGYKLAK